MPSTESPTPVEPKRTALHRRNGRNGASGVHDSPIRPESNATAIAMRINPPAIAVASSHFRFGPRNTPAPPLRIPERAGTIASCATTFDGNRTVQTCQ